MKNHKTEGVSLLINVETFLKIKITVKYNILVTNISILRQYENTIHNNYSYTKPL